jgi:hypothetical protein
MQIDEINNYGFGLRVRETESNISSLWLSLQSRAPLDELHGYSECAGSIRIFCDYGSTKLQKCRISMAVASSTSKIS